MHPSEGDLRRYLDEELGEAARAAIEAHLQDCSRCLEALQSAWKGDSDKIADALRRRPLIPPRPRPTATDPDPARKAGLNLLFGLLALQNNFVDRDALLGALNTWLVDKSRHLGRILLERGALDTDTHALLEALARKHLDRHGGDPERSLASLSSLGPLRRDLENLADPELHASLADIISDRDTEPEPDATRTYPEGRTTAPAGRFRILRPLARGGLGEVYVARDEELRREVALKQIQERYAHDPQSRSRFVVETEITGGLEHPGIIPIYGLGRYDDGRPFYAMRFVKGTASRTPSIGSTGRRSRAATRATGLWSYASCWDGSSTSATPWRTRTAGVCYTATSSRATSCWARTARRWSSTGA
jgi:hypothetical protein